MELVKRTPEEQAKIDEDKDRPHCVVVVYIKLDESLVFQDHAAKLLERAMIEIKVRADAAKMLVLSTSISSNLENGFFSVMILCQWAQIEKLEEQQRRAFLANQTGPGPGRRGA